MNNHDLLILGGGPGGYAAALYGASAGLNVGLVEQAELGGTCLHRGCIPAKELLQTAEVLRTTRRSKEFGIDVGEPTLDLKTSQERKASIVGKLTQGLSGLLSGRKVTVYAGRGMVDSLTNKTISVEGQKVSGKNLILATGSSPRALPGLAFDGEKVLSSDHVLSLDAVPGKVAIIGGGAIGCEFASFLIDVGAEVTLLEAMDQLLPGVDSDIAELMKKVFTKRGINCFSGARVEGIDQVGSELVVRFKTAAGPTNDVTVDKVIVSIGRSPNTAGFGIDKAGITDEAGYIAVDDHMRTSVDGVYAVGDAVPTPALAHVAFSEAILAVKTILGEQAPSIEYSKVPWGIYSNPEVGFVGLSETAAKASGHDVVVSKHRFSGNSRAMIIGEPEGMVKIVADRSGAILGTHVVGPWATELVTEAYLAINWDATVDDVATLIHPHPTLGELIGESVLALTGRSLHG